MNRAKNRLFLVAAALVFLPAAAFGAEFCVNNSTQLQNALTEAESNWEDDIIRVSQGTYNGPFTYYSTQGFAIRLLGGYKLFCTTRSLDPSITVLSGAHATNVLYLYNREGGDIEVEGFTIKNGVNGSGSGLAALNYSESGFSGHIKIRKNVIIGNTTQGPCMGGGAFVVTQTFDGIAGDIMLHQNEILKNTGGAGGGVFAQSYSIKGGSAGSIYLTKNIINDNGSDRFGGGAYLTTLSDTGKTGSIYVTDNLVNRNRSNGPGGGIYTKAYANDGSSGSITITGNTITDNAAGGDESTGGGIVALAATYWGPLVKGITIRNNAIKKNSASSHGGGAYIHNYCGEGGKTGDIVFDSNTVEDNTSGFGGGGVMIQAGGAAHTGDATIIDSTFSGNTPEQARIHLRSSPDGLTDGDINLTNVTVNGNLSPSPADGFFLDTGGYTRPGDVNITNVAVTGLDGYGVWVRNSDVITITGSKFSNNSGYGAEITGKKISVTNSEFIANQGRGIAAVAEETIFKGNIVKWNTFHVGGTRLGISGGGLLILARRLGGENRTEVTNNIIVGNTIYHGDGAGIGYQDGEGGIIILTQNTIAHNTAHQNPDDPSSGRGGGIYAWFGYNTPGTRAYLGNNIVWGNTATGTWSGNANDIHLTNCKDLWGLNNIYSDMYPAAWSVSYKNMDVDPKFKDVSDPNPANRDYHLALGSPAIDAGNAFSPAAQFDFEGELRPHGAGYDIGADEYTDSDGDGVPDYEEKGPDGDTPDYNGDGIPDHQQSNVASLNTYDGRYYVTLASPDGTSFTDVRTVEPPENLSVGLDLPFGVFRFTINNVVDATTVTIRLPEGETATTYVKCHPVGVCNTFLYDGQTGAEFSGNVITLHFVDGERGDHDETVNGVIVDPGGPGVGCGSPRAPINPPI